MKFSAALPDHRLVGSGLIPAIVSQTTPIFWSLMVAGGARYAVGAGF